MSSDTPGVDCGSEAAMAEALEAAEKRIRELEEKIYWYEAILDSTPMPITVTDPETKWTFVNKAVEKMLGVKREDIYGKTCNHWNANICNTENCGIECILRGVPQTQFSQDGKDYLVDVSILRDADGTEIGFIEVVQDITKLHDVERLLREQSTEFERKMYWYESILDSTPMPITVTDPETKWTFVNKAVEKMLGVRREDIYGKTCNHWNANICNTENCGIECILRGIPQTQFTQDGKDYLVDVAILRDADSTEIGFIEVVQDITEIIKLRRVAEEQTRIIVDSITYASKIQRNLLPLDNEMTAAFTDYSVIWEPRDIVGGDIYWMKRFEKGTVLCVADCTGHGTPGALLTMLVTSALEAVVSSGNCDDTADILYRLDQRLSKALHVAADSVDSECESERGSLDIDDGCDIAVIFIAADGSVTFSSGKIPVFVCDGKRVVRYKGQRIFIGEGRLKSAADVVVHSIPAGSDNKFYVASDGLFDQKGGAANIQFGYRLFEHIILENHAEKQAVITGKVWDAFEEYRGQQARRDDFELVGFVP